MQIARLKIGSALAGGVLGVAAMVGVGIGVNSYTASAQTPPSATATPSKTPTAEQQARQAERQAQEDAYLSKLATNLGTTVDKLKAANVTTMNQLIDEAQAAGKITADQATQAKARVTQDGGSHLGGMPFGGDHGKGGPGGRGPGGPGGAMGMAGPREAVDAVATYLGVDAKTLMTELQSGKSLAQVAQDHGKSRDDLKAALTAKFGSVVDQLIDRTFQMPQGGPRGGTAPAPSSTPSS